MTRKVAPTDIAHFPGRIMGLNPRTKDDLPEPHLRTGTGTGKYDHPVSEFRQTKTGWHLKTRPPASAPKWIYERLVVVCDNMFEKEEDYEYHVVECGEYKGKLSETETLRLLPSFGITPAQSKYLVSYARHWCCASLAHREPRGRQEMLGDRWNLSAVLPEDVWRRFEIGWGWREFGSGYIPR